MPLILAIESSCDETAVAIVRGEPGRAAEVLASEVASEIDLNREFGGERFAVVTIATGRNMLPAITRLFDETGVETLPVYLDPGQALAREMAVFGLPVTVILDPEGREIARMTGDADWSGESARAIVRTLLAKQ